MFNLLVRSVHAAHGWLKGVMLAARSYGDGTVLFDIGQIVLRNGVLMGAGLLVTSLVTSVLTLKQYGEYQFTLSIVNSLAFLSLTGVNRVVMQETAKGRHGILRRAIALRLRAGLVYVVVLLIIAGYYFMVKDQSARAISIMAALIFPLPMALESYQYYLLGRRNYSLYAWLPVLTGLGVYGAMALVVWLTRLPTVLLLGAGVAQLILTFAALRITLRFEPAENESYDSSALRFGMGLSALGIVGSVSSQLDTLLVGTFLTLPQVAVLSIANLVADKSKLLLAILSEYVGPRIVAHTGREMYRRANLAILVYMLVLAAFVGTAALCVPFLFRWFFPSYLDIVPLAILSLFSVLTSAPTRIIDMTLTSESRLRQMTSMRIIQFGFESTVLFIMIQRSGVVGAIASRYVSGISWTLLYTAAYLRNRRMAIRVEP